MVKKTETTIEKMLRLKQENHAVSISFSKSTIAILVEKEEYHRRLIEENQKELEETRFLIDMYNRHFSFSKSSQDDERPIKTFYGREEILNLDKKAISNNDILEYDNYNRIMKSYYKEDEKRGKQFWRSNVVDIIRAENKLLRSSEILNNAIMDVSREERKIEMVTLSTTLAELCEEKVLQKVNVTGTKGFYYGLPEMFQDDCPKPWYLTPTEE